MNKQVRVVANPDGDVITVTENPEFGYIKVEQEREVVNEETGFITVKTVSALVMGTMKDLKRLGWVIGQALNGTIVFREQLLPFNKKNPDKDLKIAGETKVHCKVNGSSIYRRSFYAGNPSAVDTLIAHDNGDEIKQAYHALEKEEEDLPL